MKTWICIGILCLGSLMSSNDLYAQGRKNPTSAEAAEKILAKNTKKKNKENEKAMKEAKKTFAKKQTPDYRRSLKRNKRMHKRKSKGLN
jgi:hypothetical protein